MFYYYTSLGEFQKIILRYCNFDQNILEKQNLFPQHYTIKSLDVLLYIFKEIPENNNFDQNVLV